MVWWNSLIILKVIKKPSGKSYAFGLTTNGHWNFFEKFLKITYENLNGKLTFYPFSIPSSRSFVILYSSENNTIFLQHVFRFRGWELPPPPNPSCGRRCCRDKEESTPFSLTFASHDEITSAFPDSTKSALQKSLPCFNTIVLSFFGTFFRQNGKNFLRGRK